ncbi:transposase [Paenibacillus aquistagni]|nr:transposase [Paenibacillus aquistagni]
MLQQVHPWKEAFAESYDHSPDVNTADIRLDRWVEQGEQIQHPAIDACLKTIRNWREENCKLTSFSLDKRYGRRQKQPHEGFST